MKVTLKHVAQLANVSPITVSRVINNQPNVRPATRQAVKEAMERLNYHPNRNARSLASAKSGAIGLIIPVTASHIFGNSLYTAVIHGVTSFFEQHGYRILLHTIGMGADYAALFHEKWIDGAILMTITRGDLGFLQLYQEGFPIVMSCPFVEEVDVPMVDIDNTKAAYEAVEYLIQTGHRRIAILSGPPSLASCRLRKTGYELAHQAAGLRMDPNLSISTDFAETAGYTAMRKLLARGVKMDALFAFSDVQAIGAMRALREAGAKVPDDISVVGFDGIEVTAYLDPALTTIVQPGRAKGRKAAEMLLQLLNGEPLARRKEVLPYHLEKRSSVRDRT